MPMRLSRPRRGQGLEPDQLAVGFQAAARDAGQEEQQWGPAGTLAELFTWEFGLGFGDGGGLPVGEAGGVVCGQPALQGAGQGLAEGAGVSSRK